jgi:hypothetical protein
VAIEEIGQGGEPGLWSIERHTIAARRPSGARTLASSETTAGRSGKYWRPSWQTTTSKAWSAKGRRSVLA